MTTPEAATALSITLTVNGRPEDLDVSPSDTLVEVLRGRFGLFSCRETCGIGVCGTCTVLVDGRQLSACLTLAFTVDGASIDTAEGLAGAGELSEVQQAFVDEQAFQCSFCTPGFVLGVEAWQRDAEAPEGSVPQEELERQLTGHLCRCGCYRQILAAARRVGG